MDPENDTSTGDDGLTADERAEVAADAASAGAATTTVADAGKTTEVADDTAAKAAATATENAAAKAITDAAGAMTEAARALAAANAPKTEVAATTDVVARDFDAERVALKADYDAGKIDEDQYEAAREKILEDRADARAQATVRTALESDRQASVQADWDRTVSRFKQDPNNAALFESTLRAAAFNAQVHASAALNPTGSPLEWLTAARDVTLKAFGVIAAEPTDAAKSAEAIAKAAADRKAAAGNPAPTLDRAPQAGSSIAQGPDAALDNLPISDLEDTLARLPADKVDAYLASSPGGLKDNPRAA